jgi:hypothetical protein
MPLLARTYGDFPAFSPAARSAGLPRQRPFPKVTPPLFAGTYKDVALGELAARSVKNLLYWPLNFPFFAYSTGPCLIDAGKAEKRGYLFPDNAISYISGPGGLSREFLKVAFVGAARAPRANSHQVTAEKAKRKSRKFSEIA